MTWTIIVNLILVFIPILIGARLRYLKAKGEHYYKAGEILQVCAIMVAFILFVIEFMRPSDNLIPMYIGYGVSVLLYSLTSLYIYLKVVKK